MNKIGRRIVSALIAGAMIASLGVAGANTAMAAAAPATESISEIQDFEENSGDGSDQEEVADSDVKDNPETDHDTNIGADPENEKDEDMEEVSYSGDSSMDENTDPQDREAETAPEETEEASGSEEPAMEEEAGELAEETEGLAMLASPEPNYTQGGAGTRTDVTDQVRLWTTQRVRYNYSDNGRNYGSFFTIMSNMVSEDGAVAGWSICVDPKKNGLYAGLGGSFSYIYRFDAPLMKKALYYADGTGHNYAREIYAQSHGGSTDEGGVLILMHAAVSEIYARLGWAYKSSAGDYQSGASDLLTEDVKRYVALLNTLPDVSGEYYVYVGMNRDNDYQDFAFLSKRLEKGSLTLTKTGGNHELTDGNSLYSLEGAVYTVYGNSGLTDVIGTLTTKADGTTEVIDNLAPGTYYVKETKVPLGYSLDETVHKVEVKAGQQAVAAVSDKPLYDSVIISIEKRSSQELSGGRSTAGTQFEIQYYPAFYETEEEISAQQPVRTWKIEARDHEQGTFARLDEEHLLEGSDELFMADGKPVLPLGTIVMQEIRAADGFDKGGSFENTSLPQESLGEVFIGQITGEDSASLFYRDQKAAEDGFLVINTPISGGVKVAKLDYESKSSAAQGEAVLAGAVLEIVSENENIISVDGKEYKKGETVLTLTTDEDGLARTEIDALPYGTYTVVETQPPAGYSQSGITERTFSIEKAGVLVDLTDPSKAILNRVIRGDIAFRKIEASSGKSIAGVDFVITQISTGEKHTITVDENGMFDSRNSDLWFGEGERQEDTGALPFGEYLIEEVQAEVNADYQMYRGSFTVSEDGQLIDLHNIENRDKPDLGTELTSESGSHERETSQNVVLTDTVSYYNFDQYVGKNVTFKGILMDKSTGEPLLVGGKEVTAEKTVAVKHINGQVELTFTFDASGISNKEIVAFENAYDESGLLIAAHTELKDASQTVKFTEKKNPENPERPKTTPTRGVKTGDEANVLLWSVLLLGAAGLAAAAAIALRKNRKQ